jgi:hypothetical protein
MQNTLIFPECFAGAKAKLRMRFRKLSLDTIDDSIQYARIQYWKKQISESIPNADEAFRWFLKAAIYYLYKEAKRLKKKCDISAAVNLYIVDPERGYIIRDWFNLFTISLANKGSSVLLQRAIGYTLKEQAMTEGVSLEAMKQRHSREKRKHMHKADILFFY